MEEDFSFLYVSNWGDLVQPVMIRSAAFFLCWMGKWQGTRLGIRSSVWVLQTLYMPCGGGQLITEVVL